LECARIDVRVAREVILNKFEYASLPNNKIEREFERINCTRKKANPDISAMTIIILVV
jgi:hypothetical protein